MNFGSYFSFYKVWGRQRACRVLLKTDFREERRGSRTYIYSVWATYYIPRCFFKNVLLHFPRCLMRDRDHVWYKSHFLFRNAVPDSLASYAMTASLCSFTTRSNSACKSRTISFFVSTTSSNFLDIWPSTAGDKFALTKTSFNCALFLLETFSYCY